MICESGSPTTGSPGRPPNGTSSSADSECVNEEEGRFRADRSAISAQGRIRGLEPEEIDPPGRTHTDQERRSTTRPHWAVATAQPLAIHDDSAAGKIDHPEAGRREHQAAVIGGDVVRGQANLAFCAAPSVTSRFTVQRSFALPLRNSRL